jgi:WD40 repeat protein
LASGSEDATVRIWDVASAREELVLRGHAERVQSVAFSPDGTRLASASLWSGAEVKVWHLPTGGQEVLNLRPPSGVCERITFSPDGRCLLGSYGDGAVLWDSESPPR